MRHGGNFRGSDNHNGEDCCATTNSRIIVAEKFGNYALDMRARAINFFKASLFEKLRRKT